MKKINPLLFTLALLILCTATPSTAQYIPNAPFKETTFAAPDFSLKDLTGKVFTLNKQKGKPVLLFFGTTWCPSCRKELPRYKELYATYSGRMEFVYINIMESREKVTKFAKSNSFPFKVLLDESGEVATDYAVVGVPTLVLINKEGNLVNIAHTTTVLNDPIKKLFPTGK
ncbi:MAG TPA: TlpA disulfide reductase family protein [Smithellaceae bacterium]|nr:TlpA disulfide reductase family protein [Smithellaceae bacterium]